MKKSDSQLLAILLTVLNFLGQLVWVISELFSDGPFNWYSVYVCVASLVLPIIYGWFSFKSYMIKQQMERIQHRRDQDLERKRRLGPKSDLMKRLDAAMDDGIVRM